jgi:hypothetical protein
MGSLGAPRPRTGAGTATRPAPQQEGCSQLFVESRPRRWSRFPMPDVAPMRRGRDVSASERWVRSAPAGSPTDHPGCVPPLPRDPVHFSSFGAAVRARPAQLGARVVPRGAAPPPAIPPGQGADRASRRLHHRGFVARCPPNPTRIRTGAVLARPGRGLAAAGPPPPRRILGQGLDRAIPSPNDAPATKPSGDNATIAGVGRHVLRRRRCRAARRSPITQPAPRGLETRPYQSE